MFFEFFLHVHYTYAYVRIHAHYFLVHVIVLNLLTLLLIDGSNPAPGGTMQYLFFVFFSDSWLLLFPTVLLILYGSLFFETLKVLHCRHHLLSKWQSSNSTNSHGACRAFAQPRLPRSRQRCWSLQLNSQSLCFVFVSHVIRLLRGGLEVVNNWHWNLKPNQKIQQDLLVGSTKRTSFWYHSCTVVLPFRAFQVGAT